MAGERIANERGRTPGVDSARRVLNVLLLFTEERPRLMVDEIAEDVEISVPSAYRYVSLLREMDLVEENGPGTYALTPRIFAPASSAERTLKSATVLRPLVEKLSAVTREAALVIRRVGDHATCAQLMQTEHAIRLSFTPGQIMSLHLGAGPKVLLAGMGQEWAARYLDRVGVVRGTADRDALLGELATIASQGWATSSSEVDEGVWAVAAPVTVSSRTVAAVSVAGPQYRIDEARGLRILDEVVESAAATSNSLTWP